MGVEEFFDSDVADEAEAAPGGAGTRKQAPRWAHPAVLVSAGLVVAALIFTVGVLLV
ncbi:hypothetical protein [Saccharothrix coeruleofusca]|uniref:Uncharacterized protein n=1 Tax=Saccharothrix coeruleofusca TaxID=33919 RepID=A0A918EDM6_9PSEU|nr:hypothetical protein [Saccharothrix coeruleofusca]MBP2339319.1 hypothetical protein [Saccharothrix coeruleofusca]GGP58585.1 hypothetical protein GCM10010185_33810 [Saccharothrix coeruleofusca]